MQTAEQEVIAVNLPNKLKHQSVNQNDHARRIDQVTVTSLNVKVLSTDEDSDAWSRFAGK